METLCASSEEDNLRSEKYVSDQPESDLMLIPKITNGNSNSKETVKNDEKGIKEKINLKEEEDVTCSGPNSMSTVTIVIGNTTNIYLAWSSFQFLHLSFQL